MSNICTWSQIQKAQKSPSQSVNFQPISHDLSPPRRHSLPIPVPFRDSSTKASFIPVSYPQGSTGASSPCTADARLHSPGRSSWIRALRAAFFLFATSRAPWRIHLTPACEEKVRVPHRLLLQPHSPVSRGTHTALQSGEVSEGGLPWGGSLGDRGVSFVPNPLPSNASNPSVPAFSPTQALRQLS